MVVLSMKRTFYKEGIGYIMATGECPPAFKGVMFVVWGGSVNKLEEGVRSLDQLKKLEEVDEVPRDWLSAFADVAGFDIEPVPETKPSKPRTNSRDRDTPLDEFVGHCAVGTDPITAAVASGLFDQPHDEPEVPEDNSVHNVVVSLAVLVGTFVAGWFYLWL